MISHSRTSPLVSAPPQLPLFPSPTTCAVDDFQRLRFDNSQSPDKFTGKPKIVSHPTSSQESLKHKWTFKFKFCTIYEFNGTSRYLIQGHPSMKDFGLLQITTQSSPHCCSTRKKTFRNWRSKLDHRKSVTKTIISYILRNDRRNLRIYPTKR